MGLTWKGYHRNREEVLKRLKKGNYEAITGNNQGLMDRFFAFMHTLGFLDLVEKVKGEGYQRIMIPIAKLLLTYQAKVLLGISSMNKVPDLLLNEIGILKLIGFTARQIKGGYCERGKGEHIGPFHRDTLADCLKRLSSEEVEKLLNSTIRLLAKSGFLQKKLRVALDSTDLETTEKYEGVGKKRKEKKVKGKKVMVTVYGWKLIIIQDLKSRMILAAKVVKINRHETNYLRELINQARQNLEGTGIKIKQVVCDRGFLDGGDQWWLEEQGMKFIVPAKSNMQVAQDAQGFRNQKPDGKYLFREEGEGITAYGIRELKTFDQYGDKKHRDKNRYSKDFEANPINACVVTKWDGREYGPGKEKVFLTNLDVNEPLRIIGYYGERSQIENQGFRELKQGWQINEFPNKAKRAVFAHILLTLIVFNLANGFRTDRGCSLADKGIRRFRYQEMKGASIHKLVVFAGKWYAIIDVEELMILLGKPPKELYRIDPEEVAF